MKPLAKGGKKMEWQDLPTRYKGAEIGGVVGGFGRIFYEIFATAAGIYDSMPTSFEDVGYCVAVGAFFGYGIGAIVDMSKKLYYSNLEEKIEKNKISTENEEK